MVWTIGWEIYGVLVVAITVVVLRYTKRPVVICFVLVTLSTMYFDQFAFFILGTCLAEIYAKKPDELASYLRWWVTSLLTCLVVVAYPFLNEYCNEWYCEILKYPIKWYYASIMTAYFLHSALGIRIGSY